jgi:hypothetical protein
MEGDENLFPIKKYPPLLQDEHGRKVFEAEATCIEVYKSKLGLYQRETFVFTFRIVNPEELRGIKLDCYAPWRRWKRSKFPPKGSKIAKLAEAAMNGRKVRMVTKSMFLNKLFLCRVRPTKGDQPYSVVDMVLRKLAGE